MLRYYLEGIRSLQDQRWFNLTLTHTYLLHTAQGTAN